MKVASPDTNDRHRVVLYVTSSTDLEALLESAEAGTLTHALVSLFHLGYDDENNKTGPYVHLGDHRPSDPRFDELWATVKTVQGYGTKVMASLGGAGVGDYGNLFAAYDVFYPLLCDALESYDLDGLDTDTEESGITTGNIQQLIGDLRRSFAGRAGGFLLSSAPVASALTDGGSVSSGVDYHRLLEQFDWYNLQFYGWGSLPSGSSSPPPNYTPNYEAVVAATGSANVSKLVAGVLTNPDDGNGYVSLSELRPVLSALAGRYADFGGVMGWNYGNALGPAGTVDPAGWAAAMAASLQAS